MRRTQLRTLFLSASSVLKLRCTVLIFVSSSDPTRIAIFQIFYIDTRLIPIQTLLCILYLRPYWSSRSLPDKPIILFSSTRCKKVRNV